MRKQILGLCLGLAAFAAAAAGVENKWRLQFSGNAESAGRIVLELSPSVGEPIRASADIPQGLGENDVAKSVRGALQAQAGKRYSVEVDDGEDVLVKRRGSTPRFDIRVIRNTAKGLHIDLDWE